MLTWRVSLGFPAGEVSLAYLALKGNMADVVADYSTYHSFWVRQQSGNGSDVEDYYDEY